MDALLSFQRLWKSPDTLVLRQKEGGLKLVHQLTGESLTIGAKEAVCWTRWEDRLDRKEWGDVLDQLILHGFILQRHIPEMLPAFLELDSLVPLVSNKYVKWYQESPDLFVLFNTQSMSDNNPLLVLGPYGSLCWQGIIAGWSIGQIRRESARIFGSDEVLLFLQRLEKLDFIKPISQLSRFRASPEKLTKEFLAPMVQFQLTHAAIPWYCLWEVCTTCNLRCRSCYLSNFSNPGPNPVAARVIAKQIVESGIFYVCLLGGEPLLRNDLEEIIEQLRIAGVFVKIISNGQQLTLDRARVFATIGLNQIEISFDGFSLSSHQFSRGKGTFQRALSAVRHAQQAGIPRIAIVWTIHTGNFHELTLLPSFIRSIGVRECYISLFKKTGLQGSSVTVDPLTPSTIQELRKQVQQWKQVFPELTITVATGCSCGRTSMVIGSNGDVRTCSFQYLNMGNLFQTHLKDIWHSVGLNVPEQGPVGYCRKCV